MATMSICHRLGVEIGDRTVRSKVNSIVGRTAEAKGHRADSVKVVDNQAQNFAWETL